MGPHNLVFDQGRIVGVIDFECAGRGDSVYDVAGMIGRSQDRLDFVDRLVGEEFTPSPWALRLCAVAHVLRGINFELGQGASEGEVLADAEATLDFFWHLM